MTRNVGKLGEDALTQWAHQVGLTVTKATEDEQGWDFLLEAELPSLKSNPAKASYDKRASRLKCWIQVKSTDSFPGSWQVKLDNWERLVKTPYPAFFLVCEFNGKDTCQQAFLVHIDESHIRAVMRRLRELALEPGKQPHEAKMTFKYSESHQLASLGGTALMSSIDTAIGHDVEEYAAKKARTVKTVGYENGGFSISFTTPIPQEHKLDPLDYWVDFTLGLIPSLDTHTFTIRDTRFGIEVPELTKTHEGGRLEIALQPIAQGYLTFSSRVAERKLRVPVEVLLAQGVPNDAPMKYRKIRCKTDFIDLVVLPEVDRFDGKLNLKLPPPYEFHSLESVYPAAALLLQLYEAHRNGCQLTSEIWIDSARLGAARIDPTQYFDPLEEHYIKLAGAVLHAVVIAKHLDLPLGTNVRLQDLYSQAEVLQIQAESFSQKLSAELRITYQMASSATASITNVCFPLILQSLIGTHLVMIAGVVTGKPEIVEQLGEDSCSVELKTNEFTQKRTWTLDQGESPKEAITLMLQAVVDEYSKTHNVVLSDEFQKLLE